MQSNLAVMEQLGDNANDENQEWFEKMDILNDKFDSEANVNVHSY